MRYRSLAVFSPKIRRSDRCLVLSACAIIFLSGCGNERPAVLLDKGDGRGAESFARTLDPPTCTSQLINSKTSGLVVLAFTANKKGRVTSTKILESPGDGASEAVTSAAKRAIFEMPWPEESKDAHPGTGRLFFYFHCSSFPLVVEQPKDRLAAMSRTTK